MIDIDLETFVIKSDELNKKNKTQCILLCEYCGNKKVIKTLEDLKGLREIKRADVPNVKHSENKTFKQTKLYKCGKCGRCLSPNIVGKKDEYYS
jgi:DNA-directed RNA polymerase subunit RPC12/RpoP